MLVQIDDQLCAKYQAHAATAHIPLPKLLERQLARFADTPITQRVLALTGEDLQTLDTLLGVGSSVDARSLVRAVRAFAGITIGGVTVDFSPAQLAEIQHRAEKQGKTPEAVVQDIVAQMTDMFFWDVIPTR
jgi:hypothetical protein